VNKIRPGLVPIYRGFHPSARDRCGLKSHTFFHRGLEIGEFFHGGVLRSRLGSVSASRGGHRVSVGLVQATRWLCWAAARAARVGEAGHARLGRFRNEARLGRLGWVTQKMEKGREKKRLAGLDSVSSWVSARYQIGIRKILFFFKYFYNLQTNLNSIQI
jgi:hypothetical protein